MDVLARFKVALPAVALSLSLLALQGAAPLLEAAVSNVQPAAAPELAASTDTPAPVSEKLVIAAYFPWYGVPSGPSAEMAHWEVDGIRRTTDTPRYLYDNRDPELIRNHIAQAKKAGIDAFAVSWWGVGSREDLALRIMLDTAQKLGTDFRYAVHLEVPGLAKYGHAGMISQIRYLLSTYSNHKNFLRVNGRPVIFVYNILAYSLDFSEWDSILHDPQITPYNAIFMSDQVSNEAAETFDGLYMFGPLAHYYTGQIPGEYANAAYIAKREKKYFAATAIPGYDDRAIRFPSWNPVVSRDNSYVYRHMWDLALSTKPDWIFISTWNEWHEGMEIEPSLEYGDLYLDLTARYSRMFKAGVKGVAN